jgi:hypothetical protein
MLPLATHFVGAFATRDCDLHPIPGEGAGAHTAAEDVYVLIAALTFAVATSCLLTVLYDGVYRQRRLQSKAAWRDFAIYFVGVAVATCAGVLGARRLGAAAALLPIGVIVVIFIAFSRGAGVPRKGPAPSPDGSGAAMRSLGMWLVAFILTVVLVTAYLISRLRG